MYRLADTLAGHLKANKRFLVACFGAVATEKLTPYRERDSSLERYFGSALSKLLMN
jgi:hypothetical protein